MNRFLTRALQGSAAGLAATIPMTVFMDKLLPELPRDEQYPLPPRQITESVAEKAGVRHETTEEEKYAATMLSHFAYGAGVGAAYSLISRAIPLPSAVKGPLYGLGIWGGGYLGWLPAAGILKPATRQPLGRNALMIGAHVVWGLTAAWMISRWNRSLAPYEEPDLELG